MLFGFDVFYLQKDQIFDEAADGETAEIIVCGEQYDNCGWKSNVKLWIILRTYFCGILVFMGLMDYCRLRLRWRRALETGDNVGWGESCSSGGKSEVTGTSGEGGTWVARELRESLSRADHRSWELLEELNRKPNCIVMWSNCVIERGTCKTIFLSFIECMWCELFDCVLSWVSSYVLLYG